MPSFISQLSGSQHQIIIVNHRLDGLTLSMSCCSSYDVNTESIRCDVVGTTIRDEKNINTHQYSL